MAHCSDDDLVLAYYGESDAADAHVAHCGECAVRYRELQSMLALIGPGDVPSRDDRYGLEVWQRIRHRLPEVEPRWYAVPVRWRLMASAGAAAVVLIVTGFVAGRVSSPEPASITTERAAAGVDDDTRRRVLMLTVADHLERSERVLTEIVNAPAGADLSTQQEWAGDLLASSRLYRQDLIDNRELTIASVLDDLERTLLEIVHRPSLATDADLDAIRRRVDSVALLFKVRVMSNELREFTDPPAAASPTLTSTIG